MSPEEVAAFVARSRASQALPRRIESPEIIAAAVELVVGPDGDEGGGDP